MKRRPFHRLAEDFRSYDRHNCDEDKVLRSHYFSCYRGIKVLRTNRARSGALGLIFLKRRLPEEAPEDELRHEYGHIVQMKRMGIFSYFFKVFLPSARSNARAPDYYRAPWEVSADMLGGVLTRRHSPEEIQEALRQLPIPPEKRRRK